jgi:hypothetical protein
MSLKYILDRLAGEAGVENYSLNAEERTYLLKIINEAAEQVWEEADLPGCLREMYMCVTADNVIALPAFVGTLRAVRSAEYDSDKPWTLKDMRPRYHFNPWKELWDGWRFVGTSPLKAEISNSAPFVYKITTADSSIIVTTVGETASARRISDSMTMSAVSVTGTKSFIAVESIQTNEIANENISVEDADGNEIAVIYNDTKESRYLIYDVSKYPTYGSTCADGTRIMEVLYKMKLPILSADSDTFPVDGFDNVILMKANQLLLEKQPGKEERAILADRKVTRTIEQKMQHIEGSNERIMKFAPNKHLGIFYPYRFAPGRRMSTKF